MSFINLLVDIIYAYVDPRIRSQYVRGSRAKRIEKIAKGGASVAS